MIGVCLDCHKVIEIIDKKNILCRNCYNKRYRIQNRKPTKKRDEAAEHSKSALVEIIRLAKISHTWMLKDIRYRSDEFGVGNSDELKQAIAVQELLDMI